MLKCGWEPLAKRRQRVQTRRIEEVLPLDELRREQIDADRKRRNRDDNTVEALTERRRRQVKAVQAVDLFHKVVRKCGFDDETLQAIIATQLHPVDERLSMLETLNAYVEQQPMSARRSPSPTAVIAHTTLGPPLTARLNLDAGMHVVGGSERATTTTSFLLADPQLREAEVAEPNHPRPPPLAPSSPATSRLSRYLPRSSSRVAASSSTTPSFGISQTPHRVEVPSCGGRKAAGTKKSEPLPGDPTTAGSGVMIEFCHDFIASARLTQRPAPPVSSRLLSKHRESTAAATADITTTPTTGHVVPLALDRQRDASVPPLAPPRTVGEAQLRLLNDPARFVHETPLQEASAKLPHVRSVHQSPLPPLLSQSPDPQYASHPLAVGSVPYRLAPPSQAHAAGGGTSSRGTWSRGQSREDGRSVKLPSLMPLRSPVTLVSIPRRPQ